MNQNTPYRYEAKNDGSYNELAAYATQLMGNVSLFPELRTIVIDGRFANDVGKFIDKEGLDIFTSPIEVDEDNLVDIIHTEAMAPDTLREVADGLLGKIHFLAEENKTRIDEKTKECNEAKKSRDTYRDLYLEYYDRNNRIKKQIAAIGALINAIFSDK